jgi:hypothetical protein
VDSVPRHNDPQWAKEDLAII